MTLLLFAIYNSEKNLPVGGVAGQLYVMLRESTVVGSMAFKIRKIRIKRGIKTVYK